MCHTLKCLLLLFLSLAVFSGEVLSQENIQVEPSTENLKLIITELKLTLPQQEILIQRLNGKQIVSKQSLIELSSLIVNLQVKVVKLTQTAKELIETSTELSNSLTASSKEIEELRQLMSLANENMRKIEADFNDYKIASENKISNLKMQRNGIGIGAAIIITLLIIF